MTTKRDQEAKAIETALESLREAQRVLLSVPCREADRVIAWHSLDVAVERLESRLASCRVSP